MQPKTVHGAAYPSSQNNSQPQDSGQNPGAPAPPTGAAHPAGKAMPSTGSPLGLRVLLGAGVTGGGALKRRAAGRRG